MGQSDVVEVLLQNKNMFMSAIDIAKIIGVNRGSVSSSLRKIFKHEATTYNLIRIRDTKNMIGYLWCIREYNGDKTRRFKED